jgi:NAD(P)-dependent dehydrogenase (short-subunit alcohol dehydrogenase family)
LAKAGAEVILTCRDDRKGHSAIEKISREVPGARASYERLDLANLAPIADFSQRMHSRQSLDLLINNAGVMALPRRQTTSAMRPIRDLPARACLRTVGAVCFLLQVILRLRFFGQTATDGACSRRRAEKQGRAPIMDLAESANCEAHRRSTFFELTEPL